MTYLYGNGEGFDEIDVGPLLEHTLDLLDLELLRRKICKRR